MIRNFTLFRLTMIFALFALTNCGPGGRGGGAVTTTGSTTVTSGSITAIFPPGAGGTVEDLTSQVTSSLRGAAYASTTEEIIEQIKSARPWPDMGKILCAMRIKVEGDESFIFTLDPNPQPLITTAQLQTPTYKNVPSEIRWEGFAREMYLKNVEFVTRVYEPDSAGIGECNPKQGFGPLGTAQITLRGDQNVWDWILLLSLFPDAQQRISSFIQRCEAYFIALEVAVRCGGLPVKIIPDGKGGFTDILLFFVALRNPSFQ